MFETKLKSGALHNIKGNIGFEYMKNLSLFFILNIIMTQSWSTGKVHFAIGYLPGHKDKFIFWNSEGDDILKSK